ncbi:MAG: patatin-like phospholipase family protein [Actinomadura sp.]
MRASNRKYSADLVLEGGGVKGIALVGALYELDRAGYRFGRLAQDPTRVAGTSAGAVTGALVAAGMPVERMQQVMRNVDYRKFRDKSVVDRVPFLGKSLSLLFERGVYEGDYLREWLGNQLADLNVETFADLALDDPDPWMPEDQRFGLVVMATDVTLGQLVRLPWDYRRLYGLDPRRQLVADAVRASMSIPFFFEPVTLTHSRTGACSTLVDGGVLSNFPIDAFDRIDGREPRWPTFGVKLLPAPRNDALMPPFLGAPLLPPVRLLASLIGTAIAGHDQTRLSQPWVQARTMQVDTKIVGITDFGLTDEQQQILYNHGRMAARTFLRGWKWRDYVTSYRMPAARPAPKAARRAAPSKRSAKAGPR